MSSYSHSQISTYMACPLSWKYAKIDKRPTMASALLTQGRILHDKVDEYIKYLVKSKLTSDITWKGLTEGLDELPEGPELMDRFARSFVLNPETHSGSEVEIAITEKGKQTGWWSKDVWFRFKIDKVDIEEDRLIITDWKSGWNTDISRFQLEVYAWGLSYIDLNVEYSSILVKNHFIRYRIEKSVEIPVSTIPNIEKKVRKIVAGMESAKKFPARPGSFCSLCGYSMICSARMSLVERGKLPVIDTREKAIDYAGKVLVVQQRLNAVKNLLRGFVDENGNIPLATGIYGYNPQNTLEIPDKEKVYDALCEKGEDPLAYFNIDKRSIRKAGLPEELVKPVQEIQFGFKKRKDF